MVLFRTKPQMVLLRINPQMVLLRINQQMVLFRISPTNGPLQDQILWKLNCSHCGIHFYFRAFWGNGYTGSQVNSGSSKKCQNLYQADTLFQKSVVRGWRREKRRPWFIEHIFLSTSHCAFNLIPINQGWHTLTTIAGPT